MALYSLGVLTGWDNWDMGIQKIDTYQIRSLNFKIYKLLKYLVDTFIQQLFQIKESSLHGVIILTQDLLRKFNLKMAVIKKQILQN